MTPLKVCPVAFEKIVNEEAGAWDGGSPHFAFSRSSFVVMSKLLRAIKICLKDETKRKRIHLVLPSLKAQYNGEVMELARNARVKFLYLPYDVLVHNKSYQTMENSDDDVFWCHNVSSGMLFEDQHSGERKPMLATDDWSSEITSTSNTLGTSDANLVARDIGSRYAINVAFVANCIKKYMMGENKAVVYHADRPCSTATGCTDKQTCQQPAGAPGPPIPLVVETTQQVPNAVLAVWNEWTKEEEEQFPKISDLESHPKCVPSKITRSDDNSSSLLSLLLSCEPQQVALRLKEAQEQDASTLGRFLSVIGQLMTATEGVRNNAPKSAHNSQQLVQPNAYKVNENKAPSALTSQQLVQQNAYQTNNGTLRLFVHGSTANRDPFQYPNANQRTVQQLGIFQNSSSFAATSCNSDHSKMKGLPRVPSTSSSNHHHHHKRVATSVAAGPPQGRKRKCLTKPVGGQAAKVEFN